MLRRKLGDFFIVEHLGSGGMASVYLALNPRTQEKRAIKVLTRRATAPSLVYARFLREVEIIRSLTHPNIIRMLDSGTLDDCFYYMMDFMPGGSLADRLKRGRLLLQHMLDLFAAICDGMAYAHDRNIVHRDLKPANVLLSEAGEPVVSDFGIARDLDTRSASLTKTHEIMGTMAYLAPEQRIDAKHVDRRADVYALGAILYEMIQGYPPLGRFPWPGETQSGYPQSLQRILEKCLALNPDDRYAHAGLLYNDLARMRMQRGDAGREAPPPIFPAATPNRASVENESKEGRLLEWFRILRSGTTRERLGVVQEMIDRITPEEVSHITVRFRNEEDRVRWGLIQVLGELRIQAATTLILGELDHRLHREIAIESLGKIGSASAFGPILRYVEAHGDSAMMALMPLALTGRQQAIVHIQPYLLNPMAAIRQAAVRAIAAIPSTHSLEVLKHHLKKERDEKIRSQASQSILLLEKLLQNHAGSSEDTLILPVKVSNL